MINNEQQTPMNPGINLWKQYCRERYKVMLLGIFTVLCTNVFQVFIPTVMGLIIDTLKGEKNFFSTYTQWNQSDQFFGLCCALLAAELGITYFRYAWRITLGRETHHSSKYLRQRIWHKICHLPYRHFQKQYSVGRVMNTLTSDVNTARYIFGFTLVGLSDSIFITIFATLALWNVNHEMTLWILATTPLLPLAVKRLAKLEGNLFDRAQDHLSLFNDEVAISVGTVRLQRLSQTEEFWTNRLMRSAAAYRMQRLAAVFVSLRYIPLMGGVTVLSYVLLFFIGIGKVKTGEITIGQFIAMQSYAFLLQNPMMEFGFIISEFQRGFRALSRIAAILDEKSDPFYALENREMATERETEKVTVTDATRPEGVPESENDRVDIEFKNVEIRHRGEEHPIIRSFSIDIQKGERLGLTGVIGSGKTSLLNALLGLNRDHGGEIKIAGKNINDYSHSELRENVVIVPQSSFLFADTIRNNMTLGDEAIDDEKVWEVLELACVAKDIRAIGQGLDTTLGEFGINLSGGQKQRLTLARAIIRNPKVLLLDDCLSAVDTVTEEKILSNLDRVLPKTTMVWVAHRKSTLKYCHRIIELGEVV